MTLPAEFQQFDLQLCLKKQSEFYQNKFSVPFACTYRGMGTFWVICRSLKDDQKYSLKTLGGSDDYVRAANRQEHLRDEEEPTMSAAECVEKLSQEIKSFQTM